MFAEKEIDLSANDHTEAALAAAQNNWQLLNDEWCRCPEGTKVDGKIAYFRNRKTGDHGWMCAVCRCIVQTG